MTKKPIKERLKEHNWAIKEWAAVDKEILYSEAFAELNATAMRVYLRFLQKRPFSKEGKRSKQVRYKNTGLVFTYQEASCFKISRSSFARAIRDLIEKGFIEIEHQGGTIGNGRDWSRYRLIDDWKDYGTDKFILREKAPVIQYSSAIKRHNEKKRMKNIRTFSSVKSDTRTVSVMTPEA